MSQSLKGLIVGPLLELNDALVLHFEDAPAHDLLGENLFALREKGTGRSLVLLSLLADVLRVVEAAGDELEADDELVIFAADYVQLAARTFVKKGLGRYGHFAGGSAEDAAGMLRFHREDAGTFGGANERTHWGGLAICRHVARLLGDTGGVDRYERLMVELADALLPLCADAEAEDQIERLRGFVTESCADARRPAQAGSGDRDAERAALAAEREEIATGRAALDEERAEVARERAALAEEREELTKTWMALDEDRDELANTRRELEQLGTEREASQAEQHRLAGERSAVAEDRERLSGEQAELEDGRHALELARTEFDAEREELAAARSALESLRAELNATGGKSQTDRSELDALRAEVEAERAELFDERAALASELAELETDREQLGAREEQLQTAQGEIEQARQTLDEERNLLAAEREELATSLAALDDDRAAIAAARNECDALRRDLESRLADVQAREDELQRRDRELQQRDDEWQQRDGELQAARAALEATRSGTASTESELDELRRALDRRRTELDEHSNSLGEERRRQDEHSQSLAAERGELEQQRQAVTADRAELAERRHALESEQQALESERAELARQRSELERLQNQHASGATTLDEARSQLEADRARLQAEREAFDVAQAEYEAARQGMRAEEVQVPGRDTARPGLLAAVKAGDSRRASASLDAGADVNAAESSLNWQTPLMLAAAQGDAAMVNLLLERGANAEACDMAGRNALVLAIEGGSAEVVERLASQSDRVLRQAHQRLAALLRDRRAADESRELALTALAGLGARARDDIPVVIGLLQSRHRGVARAAAEALARIDRSAIAGQAIPVLSYVLEMPVAVGTAVDRDWVATLYAVRGDLRRLIGQQEAADADYADARRIDPTIEAAVDGIESELPAAVGAGR